MDVASETEILEIKKLLGLSKIFLANIIGFSWNVEHNSAWQCDSIWSNFTKNRRLSIKLGQKSRFLGLFSPQKQFSRIRRFFIKKCTNVNYPGYIGKARKNCFWGKNNPKKRFFGHIFGQHFDFSRNSAGFVNRTASPLCVQNFRKILPYLTKIAFLDPPKNSKICIVGNK